MLAKNLFEKLHVCLVDWIDARIVVHLLLEQVIIYNYSVLWAIHVYSISM